jgi:hypothetical protein
MIISTYGDMQMTDEEATVAYFKKILRKTRERLRQIDGTQPRLKLVQKSER